MIENCVTLEEVVGSKIQFFVDLLRGRSLMTSRLGGGQQEKNNRNSSKSIVLFLKKDR